MAFEIRESRPDPTLDVLVDDAVSGDPRRLTVLSGVARVAPVETGGIHVRVLGGEPQGEQLGFYVQGSDPLPADGEVVATAEASMAQLTVLGTTSHQITYGIGDVAVQLVADERGEGRSWPYLSFRCFGGRELEVRYRVSLTRSV